MVMELPTPQCVGREFVRQYYTLLNKAPLHLHRFYNHDSSFLHGGLDRPGQETRPVVGQQDIHERIMQLNFRDCHAKIRQVDSQETLGDGVVVQVSGELSNNGQPMRRFMQTFVLVPQSPKKYYVRNDIFRYQDEVFSEDDNGEIDNALTDLDVEDSAAKTPSALAQDDDVGYHENEIVRNGSVYSTDSVVVTKYGASQPPRESRASPQPECEVESGKSDWDEEEEEEDEEEELEEEEIGTERATEDTAPEIMENPPVVSQEPKTYANMVSKNTSSAMTPSHPVTSNATSPVSNLPASHKTVEQPAVYHKNDSTPASSAPQQSGSGFNQQGNRMSRPRLNSGRGGSGRFENSGHDVPARSPEDSDADKRKANFIHYPDAQQLFVGNLTHSITEEDLKSHFTQFGKVLDMRINTKQPQKIGGGKVPNFGFIVFEDADSVQKVLAARPIYFNDHRLNVEEKKRPKDNRMISSDNRGGPPRSGPSPRVGVGGRGPRGSMMSQGTGRGDNRGGIRGSYAPRR
ncbi:ras GTPase-activating protein-binding protein 2 [Parasteatoda tepidariorum]|uniref:ras GTPase-activating protein-binding protein 2 n=1 Tax=Parasteatoda tepidariorum TaxID=114398 RepID=UPI00077F887A|nr:ras GTPase-activating protein-binding protein 2 [Parasteatoda tepidariorum]XP_015923332.1 ras GTPase-activating protein-binding protein 2 [Parasteatoda tepidariorum]XP_042903210.1 ras GTPase-activating protein-binding protein 2 [Parasteatoda tepidariorum]XP_042903212.1 ras GTPase-activating protein-binding protein 2 [Parasteatoda tepidariorum]